MAADRDTLLSVDDIGEVIADSILAYFAKPSNVAEIGRLREAGLKFSVGEQEIQASSALEGQTIVISGNFSIPREEMKKLIALNGGKNSSSVSGKTSFLLAGEKPGPEKIRKAGALGIKVMGEAEFMQLISGAGTSGNRTEAAGAAVQPTLF